MLFGIRGVLYERRIYGTYTVLYVPIHTKCLVHKRGFTANVKLAKVVSLLSLKIGTKAEKDITRKLAL